MTDTIPRCSTGDGGRRIVTAEHYDECTDPGCDGCWPCRERHCLSCGRRHTDTTCVTCLGAARADLTEIVRLCGYPLVEEMLTKGSASEAAMLLGPAADPAAWQALAVRTSMVDAKAAQAYLEDCRDEQHPLWGLVWIENEWRDAFGQPTTVRASIPRAAAYLASMLHVVAGTLVMPDGSQAPEFSDARQRLAACRSHLEDVLSEGVRREVGAPCPKCGKGALVKSWGNTEGEDRWQCRHPKCRAWWTDHDYRVKVVATYERHADALTASAVARVYRVPEGSTRAWASAPKHEVRKRGRDANGLQLYDVADVLARRDKPKSA